MSMDYRKQFAGTADGPTGAILTDLPSPYIPHSNGLLYLPRFIAKIRKHLNGGLPASYQRNFTKGFDLFLCMHLGIDPQDVIAAVKDSASDKELESRLNAVLPTDLRIAEWNKKLCQTGLSETGQEKIAELKQSMGVSDRADLMTFADLIDYDEGRIP